MEFPTLRTVHIGGAFSALVTLFSCQHGRIDSRQVNSVGLRPDIVIRAECLVLGRVEASGISRLTRFSSGGKLFEQQQVTITKPKVVLGSCTVDGATGLSFEYYDLLSGGTSGPLRGVRSGLQLVPLRTVGGMLRAATDVWSPGMPLQEFALTYRPDSALSDAENLSEMLLMAGPQGSTWPSVSDGVQLAVRLVGPARVAARIASLSAAERDEKNREVMLETLYASFPGHGLEFLEKYPARANEIGAAERLRNERAEVWHALQRREFQRLQILANASTRSEALLFFMTHEDRAIRSLAKRYLSEWISYRDAP